MIHVPNLSSFADSCLGTARSRNGNDGNDQEIWLETASVLSEAIQLYQKSGYQSAQSVPQAALLQGMDERNTIVSKILTMSGGKLADVS